MDPLPIVEQCKPVPVVTVQATEERIRQFVKGVYENDGGVTNENPMQTGIIITGLLMAADALVPQEQYKTATIVTLTMFAKDLPELDTGKIPANTAVGGFDWEKTVGLPAHTAGLGWTAFGECLEGASLQENILAEELAYVRQNHRQQNIVPILLSQGAPQMPSAAVVYKYDVFPSVIPSKDGPVPAPQHRFSLVAFQTPLLFAPNDMAPIASAYHLVVVAQLFRFSVIDKDLTALQNVSKLRALNQQTPEVERKQRTAISEIKRHFLLIDVECRRRDFFNRVAAFDRVVLDAFGLGEVPGAQETESDSLARQKQSRLSEIMSNRGWAPIKDGLMENLKEPDKSLDEAVGKLKELKRMNADVLRIASESYAKLAAKEYPPLK
jgi:hypothetical protein